MKFLMISERDRERKVYSVWGFAFVAALLLFVVGIYVGALEPVNKAGKTQLGPPFSKDMHADGANSPCRKLLTLSTADDDDDGGGGDDNGTAGGNDNGDDNSDGSGSINRIGYGDTTCSTDNILVVQGATSPLPNGIPTYTVEIQNVCSSESCSISDIHLSCGWFSSARLINPRIFRRIGYDDCLVNDGEPLNPGEVLSFQYANTFKYPLSVSSVAC